MKKYRYIESDSASVSNKLSDAVDTGCSFISRNKKKFIFGGVVAGWIASLAANKEVFIKAAKIGLANNNLYNLGIDDVVTKASAGKGFWSVLYNKYVAKQAGAMGVAGNAIGGAGSAVSNKVQGWFGSIKEFFSPVFGENGSLIGKSLPHGIVYGLVAVIVILIGWMLYKIIKKIRARKQMNTTTESYVSLLSDQSFLEAKQVAHYLKENTAMSKKDCNRIANFVYKKSLNRKLNNLI